MKHSKHASTGAMWGHCAHMAYIRLPTWPTCTLYWHQFGVWTRMLLKKEEKKKLFLANAWFTKCYHIIDFCMRCPPWHNPWIIFVSCIVQTIFSGQANCGFPTENPHRDPEGQRFMGPTSTSQHVSRSLKRCYLTFSVWLLVSLLFMAFWPL